ncbi:hypothetical protein ACM9ZV_25670, partial [Escherichia coli]|uniref:hypothetical protein n=1 Tax=Escherichia coli TaxID=562 RepID=UPI003B9C44AB
MAKVQGLFVGYRKFAVDREWLRQQEEQRYRDRQRQFDEWSRKWVTVTRLKETRLWTDGAIRRWLGEPQQQGKYKVFGTVAKLAMRQPFVLFKGLTFQKLCLPGAFRPGDHHNK